ncbi:MAG: hypothetical protein ABI551_11475 [Polyangiaceae bacterium]
MKNLALAVLVLLALSLFTGCSSGSDAGDSSGNPSFSCDAPASDSDLGLSYAHRRCATFASMPSDLRDGNCATDDGDQIVASCAADGLVGTCKVPNTYFESITYSYYSDSTLADAQKNCTGLHGTFEAAQ